MQQLRKADKLRFLSILTILTAVISSILPIVVGIIVLIAMFQHFDPMLFSIPLMAGIYLTVVWLLIFIGYKYKKKRYFIVSLLIILLSYAFLMWILNTAIKPI